MALGRGFLFVLQFSLRTSVFPAYFSFLCVLQFSLRTSVFPSPNSTNAAHSSVSNQRCINLTADSIVKQHFKIIVAAQTLGVASLIVRPRIRHCDLDCAAVFPIVFIGHNCGNAKCEGLLRNNRVYAETCKRKRAKGSTRM